MNRARQGFECECDPEDMLVCEESDGDVRISMQSGENEVGDVVLSSDQVGELIAFLKQLTGR